MVFILNLGFCQSSLTVPAPVNRLESLIDDAPFDKLVELACFLGFITGFRVR